MKTIKKISPAIANARTTSIIVNPLLIVLFLFLNFSLNVFVNLFYNLENH